MTADDHAQLDRLVAERVFNLTIVGRHRTDVRFPTAWVSQVTDTQGAPTPTTESENHTPTSQTYEIDPPVPNRTPPPALPRNSRLDDINRNRELTNPAKRTRGPFEIEQPDGSLAVDDAAVQQAVQRAFNVPSAAGPTTRSHVDGLPDVSGTFSGRWVDLSPASDDTTVWLDAVVDVGDPVPPSKPVPIPCPVCFEMTLTIYSGVDIAGMTLQHVPAYSGDIRAAWDVVSRICARGRLNGLYDALCSTLGLDDGARIPGVLTVDDLGMVMLQCKGNVLAEAICLAALAALDNPSVLDNTDG